LIALKLFTFKGVVILTEPLRRFLTKLSLRALAALNVVLHSAISSSVGGAAFPTLTIYGVLFVAHLCWRFAAVSSIESLAAEGSIALVDYAGNVKFSC
jgi:hypothetical protein